MLNKTGEKNRGFTLVEVLLDITVFALVAFAVLDLFLVAFKSIAYSKKKISAVAIANAKMEEMRNLPYDSLATEHGLIYPPGNILDDEEVVSNNFHFNVHTTIFYVDDSYDGVAAGPLDGKPQDSYAYDYKKIEVAVSLIGGAVLTNLTSNVAAKAAETESGTGILRICVVDSISNPVPGALVTISNTTLSPPLNMQATTGSDGCIMVPKLPPDEHNHYHITVIKDGYSTDYTNERTAQNPHAVQPDVNVMVQQVTSQTFAIDKISSLNINIIDPGGQPVPNAELHIESLEEISRNPHTPKFETDLTADQNGHIEINNMEFGGYSMSVAGKTIVSTSPYQPVNLPADSNLSISIVVSDDNSLIQILSCEPLSAIKDTNPVSVNISAKNVLAGAVVKLIDVSANEIIGTNVDVSQADQVMTDFDLTGKPIGKYDIIITNPDGKSTTQKNGFEITE